MLDVARWLVELGLGRYAESFSRNDVRADVLPDLSDADLRDLGVESLGDRKRLLRAIAALADAPRPAAEPRADDPGAERRQLSILFVDLVGSSRLSARLDPEEMAGVIRGYQDAVAGVVARLGGHVAKFMGDGVLAYFGWPAAHEDSAERAVRAGLAVVGAVGALPAAGGQSLAARAGIATGLVVVGELLGSAEARERPVIGDTPNLAARLQQAAEPGTVLIAEGTHRLVGTLFEVAATGPLELKGLDDPVAAFRIVGEGRAESRFAAMHEAGMIRLVGRERELDLLLDRWRLARGGEGQVVLLSGEAGIGKSRIVEAMREAVAAEPHVSVRYFCSPQHTGTALWPVARHLERAAQFEREDPPATRLAKLEALLAETGGDAPAAAPYFADLLALPATGRFALPELTPLERKARILRAVVDGLEALSRRRPLLLVLEDAHWIDPTTREAFDLVVDRVQRMNALCLVTCRPEFQTDWTGRAHVTPVALKRLGRGQAEKLVDELTGGRPLPPALHAEILAKTEGVPLFVEELTKMVLESGLVRPAGDAYELAGEAVPLAVPDTLRDSLMARLDRFASAREVAQIGAVLGREFEHDLLAEVSGLDAKRLAAALDQLAGAELVFRRGIAPDITYSFKHALVQDAAYESLLRSRRQQLHARAAEVLRQRFPERVAAAPELLAHHLTGAGLVEQAAQAWLAAGDHALLRSAYREAVVQFNRGLAVTATMPPGTARDAIEPRLQNGLGQALISSQGPTADVETCFRRARELSDPGGADREWFRASWGLWFVSNWRMEPRVARGRFEELLRAADRSGDPALVIQGHHAAWTTTWQLGDPRAAEAHAEIGRRLYVPEQHHRFTATYGAHDAGVCCRCMLGLTRALMGMPERGAADAADGEAMARAVNHPFSLALAMFFRGMIHTLRGEPAEVARIARTMQAVCTEQSIAVYRLTGELLEGWSIAESPAGAGDGMRRMRGAIDGLGQIRARARRTMYLGLLAERALEAGDLAAARAGLDEALDLAERTGEVFYLAELRRLDAMHALAAGDGPAAEAGLATAMEVARDQSASLLELRAAVSLAQLLAGRGERRRAHDLLASLAASITEGFAAPRIAEARTLVDQLA